jgi:O-antigen/teichoic acid export membrane protein
MLLGFVTFPILTRLLTTEEYGIMGLVSSTMFFAVALAKGGLADGLNRLYEEFSKTAEKLTIFSSTIVVRGLALSLITVVLYLTIFPHINNFLNIKDEYVVYFMIMAVSLFLRPLNIIVYGVLRVTGRTIMFNIVTLTGKMISVSLSILLLIYVIGRFYGYFVGIIIGDAAVSVILFYWFFSNYKVNLKKASGRLALDLDKFGIPLLFTELSYLLLSYVDRYMIIAYKGADVLAIYSAGYTLASYISEILMFSLTYAIVPIYIDIYANKGKEETEFFLKKSVDYLLIAIIPICFGYLAVSDDLFIALASDKYATAAVFSPLILVGSLFLGMNNILNAGLYLQKKSRTILAIMLSAVILNIVLNLILLPRYSIMGATMARLAACLFSTILTVSLSYKYISIVPGIRNILYYVMLSSVMYVIVNQIETTTAWINLVLKMIAGVLIIASGVLLREKEIRTKINALAH